MRGHTPPGVPQRFGSGFKKKTRLMPGLLAID